MIAELLKTCRFKKCYQTVSEQDSTAMCALELGAVEMFAWLQSVRSEDKAPSYFCDTLLSVEQKWVEDKWDEESPAFASFH